jgi:hypothetical protein
MKVREDKKGYSNDDRYQHINGDRLKNRILYSTKIGSVVWYWWLNSGPSTH